MVERTQCVIVGGGPAGIMLGLLLARTGVEVTVLEKHRDFRRDFRGDTVHPSTLRLLDELGLGDDFAKLPAGRLEQMRIQIGDTTLVMADFRRIPGRHKYIAMVPQWDFLDLLATAAATEPTFTLRMNCTVTDLLRDGSGRVTGVRYRDSANTVHELTAALTIGCDGRWSTVRRAAGLQGETFEVPMDVWQVRIPKGDSTYNGEVFGRFGSGQAAVTMDRGDYYQTAYLIEKGTNEARRREGITVFRSRLADLLNWTDYQVSSVQSWDEVPLLEPEMIRLRRWYDHGVLCIGDAAHTMSPVGGAGINLAVQDAVATARILHRPLRRGRVDNEDLARIQRRRTLPVKVTQNQQSNEHDMLIRPALNGTLDEHHLPAALMALRYVPPLRILTAYLGGIGLRPESAPTATRPPSHPLDPTPPLPPSTN
ncbi:FAD-dependent oxidoreductase [Nocardia sp. NPDC052001]|uniref:FAD-dependent oxidoreductase n=1 Tax=Nocardia sp. NPDC052001 TaxID=3154853 RepID=UPI00341BF4E0